MDSRLRGNDTKNRSVRVITHFTAILFVIRILLSMVSGDSMLFQPAKTKDITNFLCKTDSEMLGACSEVEPFEILIAGLGRGFAAYRQ